MLRARIALLLLAAADGVESTFLVWNRNSKPAWTPAGETAVNTKVTESATIETPRPSLPFAHPQFELARRDDTTDNPSPTLGDSSSPGQTCGTVRGHGLSPVACPPSQTCMATSAFSIGQVGCCDMSRDGCSDTPFYLDCMDATDASAHLDLEGQVTGMLMCSDTASPSCGQYIGAGGLYSGYTMFYCASTGGKIPVEWGFTDATTDPDDATSLPAVLASPIGATGSPSNATATGQTQAATTQDTLPISTATGNNAVGNGGPTPGKPSTGAMVGGAIGGIAFMGIVILAIIFAVRRHREQHQRAESPPPTPTPLYDAPPNDKQPQAYNHVMPGQQPTIPDVEETQDAPAPPAVYSHPNNISYGSYEVPLVSPPGSPPPSQGPNSFVYPESVSPQTAVAVRYRAYPPPTVHHRSNGGGPVRAGTPIPELPGPGHALEMT